MKTLIKILCIILLSVSLFAQDDDEFDPLSEDAMLRQGFTVKGVRTDLFLNFAYAKPRYDFLGRYLMDGKIFSDFTKTTYIDEDSFETVDVFGIFSRYYNKESDIGILERLTVPGSTRVRINVSFEDIRMMFGAGAAAYYDFSPYTLNLMAVPGAFSEYHSDNLELKLFYNPRYLNDGLIPDGLTEEYNPDAGEREAEERNERELLGYRTVFKAHNALLDTFPSLTAHLKTLNLGYNNVRVAYPNGFRGRDGDSNDFYNSFTEDQTVVIDESLVSYELSASGAAWRLSGEYVMNNYEEATMVDILGDNVPFMEKGEDNLYYANLRLVNIPYADVNLLSERNFIFDLGYWNTGERFRGDFAYSDDDDLDSIVESSGNPYTPANTRFAIKDEPNNFAIAPFFDENYNGIADYNEPFFNFKSDEDFGNLDVAEEDDDFNGVIAYVDNDNEPELPYDRGRKGLEAKSKLNLSENLKGSVFFRSENERVGLGDLFVYGGGVHYSFEKYLFAKIDAQYAYKRVQDTIEDYFIVDNVIINDPLLYENSHLHLMKTSFNILADDNLELVAKARLLANNQIDADSLQVENNLIFKSAYMYELWRRPWMRQLINTSNIPVLWSALQRFAINPRIKTQKIYKDYSRGEGEYSLDPRNESLFVSDLLLDYVITGFNKITFGYGIDKKTDHINAFESARREHKTIQMTLRGNLSGNFQNGKPLAALIYWQEINTDYFSDDILNDNKDNTEQSFGLYTYIEW